MGSTSYMAPEQVNGEPVDARTDLYGLGCTIHAMLTGAPPFVGVTPLSVVHQHVTAVAAGRPGGPPRRAGAARPAGPRAVGEVACRPARDAGAVAARLAGIVPIAATRRRSRELVAAGPSAAEPATAGGAGASRPAALAALAAIVLASLLAATRDGGGRRHGDAAAVAVGRGRVRTGPGAGGHPLGGTDADRRTVADNHTPTTAQSAPPSPATAGPTRTAVPVPPAPPVDPITDLRRTHRRAGGEPAQLKRQRGRISASGSTTSPDGWIATTRTPARRSVSCAPGSPISAARTS